MNKTFVVGDIHGNYKGFMQAIKRSEIDYEKDTLVSLGDVVDGHSESFEVVEELLKFKYLVKVKGNHDDWFYEWIKTGINPANWQQGQKASGLSYLSHSRPDEAWFKLVNNHAGGQEYVLNIKPSDVPQSHKDFFKGQENYVIEDDGNGGRRLFVHGGFNRHERLEDQPDFIFYWDRDLWSQALSYSGMTAVEGIKHPKFKMVDEFDEIFIGHTSTQFWGEDTPMKAANIWNLDTGGGWFGKVTIMDVDTKEYWQSDKGQELYPDFKGRS